MSTCDAVTGSGWTFAVDGEWVDADPSSNGDLQAAPIDGCPVLLNQVRAWATSVDRVELSPTAPHVALQGNFATKDWIDLYTVPIEGSDDSELESLALDPVLTVDHLTALLDHGL